MQPLVIEKHEPERRRKSVTTLHCGCSCCCCCCLHTFGSLLGAAIAPGLGLPANRGGTKRAGVPLVDYWDEETEPVPPAVTNEQWDHAVATGEPPIAMPAQRRSSSSEGDRHREISLAALPSAVQIFWWTTFVLAILTFAYCVWADWSFVGSSVIILLIVPGLQIGSSILTGLVFSFWPRPDKNHQLGQLGKITVGTFTGLGLGMIPMVLLFLMCGGCR